MMQNEIFPFIFKLHGNKESAYSKYLSNAKFEVQKPQLLSKIVYGLDSVYTDMAKSAETDTKGDIYEYLFYKLRTAGENGQFRTPRHIIRMMVELLDPKPDDTICDPAGGTSGFLVSQGSISRRNILMRVFYGQRLLTVFFRNNGIIRPHFA